MKLPSKKVISEFFLIYELYGVQKAVNYLSSYYDIGRMKIIVDGRRVGNRDESCYYKNKAYFTKRGFNKFNVLHEFCHHLVDGLGLGEVREEGEADRFAREMCLKL